MIALLAGVSGAWADVTQPTLTTDVNNPVYYTIKNYRTNKYATYTGASSQLSQVVTPTIASVWYFVANGSGVSIVPASDPTKKLASTNSASADGIVWYLKESHKAGYFCVSKSSTDVTSGTNTTEDCWDDQGSHTKIGYWKNVTNDDEGTSWMVEAAGDFFTPSLPEGKFLNVGEKASSFSVSSSASDNTHWYLITQNRLNDQNNDTGDDTPVSNVGLGSQLQRAGGSITPATLNDAELDLNTKYLVRFISAGEGLYNIQFADGTFIDASLKSTAIRSLAGKYAFYNTAANGTTFGWNLSSNTGDIVDNNGQNGNVVFWSTGTVTATSGNNVWSIYPVTFTDTKSISYEFNNTYGAFFQSLTTYKTAGETTYCNLWLSKNIKNTPQLKIITNDASSSSGNNMRSTGGLYAKTTSYQYNLAVSEGKIKSYTIVGTAAGNLSITPEGGSAEEFAANASVNKKVTLSSPAKQTSFSLIGISSAQWLDISEIKIEWETDATTVSSLAGITNDGIYTLEPYNAERGVLYAGTTYLDACGGHAPTNYPANPAVAIDASDANQQFVLYTYNGNTYLYNVGRGKFVGTASDLYYQLTNTPTNKWAVSNGAYTNYFHLKSQADSKMATINAWMTATARMKGVTISNGKDYGVTGTEANEEANNFFISRVGTLTSEQQTAIQNIIADYETLMTNLDKLDQYTIGTGLGEYTSTDFATEAYKDENISSIRAAVAGYDATTLAGVKNTSATCISNMTINSVPTNGFYKIMGYATNKYVKAGTAGSNIPNSVNQATDGTDIWYYNTDNTLINFSNGLGTINTHTVANAAQTRETATFAESKCTASGAKKIGVYEIKSNYNGSQVWYSNTNYVDRNGSNNHVNCEWVITKVTSIPVTITYPAKYSTLYTPVALTIPEGVKAYYISSLSKTEATLTKITGTIPADMAVILYADELTATTTFNFPITTADAFQGTNNLSGQAAARNVAAGDAYTLQTASNDASAVGFYPKAAGTIAGFRAYVLASKLPTDVKGFTFRFEDTDEIISVPSLEATEENVFDLSGRRVSQPTRGIYIMNGKKVFIK